MLFEDCLWKQLEVLEVSILAWVAKTVFNHCRRKSKVFNQPFKEIEI